MTVGDLKRILKNLNPEMEVVIAMDEDFFVSACMENSEVIEAIVDGITEVMFLLVPCEGHDNGGVEEEFSNDQINLN